MRPESREVRPPDLDLLDLTSLPEILAAAPRVVSRLALSAVDKLTA